MELNLQLERFQINLESRTDSGQRKIFDPIRKRYFSLTPEEYVRQLLIQFLLHELNVSRHRIGVEKTVVVNGMPRRWDVLVYSASLQPWMLIECKAPQIPLNQNVFEQIGRYNTDVQAPYLLICNGPQAYCCAINHSEKTVQFLSQLPDFPAT
jgi:hypothetical protein